ncbi:hypothetical protein DTO166G4_8548 [Paecilomyces variotii]|nr:hypothetical protein DTO166G4_8548 [Paecilomyces variotii]KAJ9229076.1 hypothetical protein DTO166G5_8158 [Paecilomyces variotii]KAJ9247482.1 hypothetical protein DTO207G8_8058 [Paecilomyces variotii]KAJ9363022.1 hypothetical protein DTO280E4_3057 [Paecilomyces variotii]KAJ9408478.1 hypothetical protein DTO045G8_3771 [Paecilomyces variotii]
MTSTHDHCRSQPMLGLRRPGQFTRRCPCGKKKSRQLVYTVCCYIRPFVRPVWLAILEYLNNDTATCTV